ncbi:nuclear transport factor 2 family protein [Enterobacter soli]|uniref:nuclear transport factor 2 family protein n=1 Tax=Enterobacter soli TaxID=885040 RepID=UPI00325BB84A
MREQPSVIDRFVDYYAGLDNQSIPALAGLYDMHAVLNDPFGEHSGLFAIQRYFTHLLTNVSTCRFAIDPPLGDTQRFAVTWTMYWSHPRIASGEIRDLPGCSMVEIQGEKIIRQRDYYDAGQMIYEHLPLLGWVVRGIKRRVGA